MKVYIPKFFIALNNINSTVSIMGIGHRVITNKLIISTASSTLITHTQILFKFNIVIFVCSAVL